MPETAKIRLREIGKCYCAQRMGNDFWFMPKGECLLGTGCNARQGTVIGQTHESWLVHWDGTKYGANEFGNTPKDQCEVING